MKTVINFVAGFLVVMGLAIASGAGGDCDGQCMELANTMGETIMFGLIGLAMFGVGALIMIKNLGESN